MNGASCVERSPVGIYAATTASQIAEMALVHTTILRWVQRYVPEFEKLWSRYARSVGGSWRCDETYINVKGRWTYLYRAVDKQGRTVDFLLTAKRDVAAAKRFFQKAMTETERRG